MNYRRILAALLVAFTLFTGATVLAAGSAADPLVSQSYLKTLFTTPLETYVQTALEGVSAAFDAKILGVQTAAEAYAREKVAASYAEELSAAVEGRVRELLAQQADGQLTAGMELAEVPKDHVITGPTGACVIFLTGIGRTEGPEGAEILNVTAGSTRTPGLDIKEGILYMILADDGSGIRVTSDTAQVLVRDGARVGTQVRYEQYALALNHLNIFRGTGSSFELERCPSRQEALIMLIRLLGEEPAAMAGENDAPFTDLTNWVDGQKYVAYAYRQGYTNGMGGGKFGPTLDSTLEQYLTFVLRSLGYKDGEDFQWDTTSRELAVQLGLLTAGELAQIDREGFLRDHVALISWRALSCQLKGDFSTLSVRLIQNGVITLAQLQEAEALLS